MQICTCGNSRGDSVSWVGKVSCPERGDIAAGAATRCGATALEALVVGHTAAHGAHCWITDAQQADCLVQRNGRHPHPRSVARARRNAAAKGFLHFERVYPFQRPKGAKYRSGPGTTNKRVLFSGLHARDPITRGQLKKIHERENAAEQPREKPVGPRLFDGSLIAAATPKPPKPRRANDEFERMAAPARAASERREQAWQARQDERVLERLHKPPRAPPDG